LINVTGVSANTYELIALSTITEGFTVPDNVSIGLAFIWIEVDDDILFQEDPVRLDTERVV
jgi:hypothetical protein